MSDLPNGAASPAPASGVAPAPQAPITEREVAGVLAGLLDKDAAPEDRSDAPPPKDPEESPDVGEPPADDDIGADESPPTDDEPAETDEPSSKTAIDPPAAWTAQDRKTWQQLPPAVQDIVKRRESELTALTLRATEERGQIEKLALTRLEQANQDRSQYVQNLEVFKQVLIPAAQQLDQVDWQRLATENPAEYVRLSAERQAIQQRVALVQGEVARVQQAYSQEVAQQQEEAKRTGYQRVIERRPELADPQKAQEIGGKLGQFLRGYGFSDAEITGLTDARAVDLALVAMEAHEARTAVQSANAKRTPPAAPQVQRPGSSQNGESASRRMTQLASRFDQTRSVQDAARIVAEWLK